MKIKLTLIISGDSKAPPIEAIRLAFGVELREAKEFVDRTFCTENVTQPILCTVPQFGRLCAFLELEPACGVQIYSRERYHEELMFDVCNTTLKMDWDSI